MSTYRKRSSIRLSSVAMSVALLVLVTWPARASETDAAAVTDASVAADGSLPQAVPPPAPKPLGPEPAPAAHQSTAPASAIQIGERRTCEVRIARNGESAETRARRASHVLEQAMEEGRPEEIRVVMEGGAAVLYVGATPLIQLGSEDAVEAGDVSTSVHAEACAAAVRQGLRTELRRRNIANLVFSISLVVLSGLLSFLLVGAVSRAAKRVSTVFEARESVPALKIGTIELATPAAVRVAVSTAISIAKPVVQIVIVFGWLLSSMSLLPLTEELGRKLTGYVLVPLTTFLGRMGAALPLLVLVCIGGFTLAMLLRFLRVFFESVAQGGIHLGWLAPQQALPVSVVIRAVAVIGAMLTAAPLLTGDTAEWGALRIAGVALTATIVLALIPILANVAIGTFTLLQGHLQAGAFIEVGVYAGRLSAVTLTELRIVDRSGAEVRMPHLVTLIRPLRLLGDSLPSHYEVVVDARAPQGPIRKALVDALRRQGRAAHVELTEIEGDRACYRVVGTTAPGEEDLASAIADELTRQNVGFTRIRKLDIG